MRTYWEIQNRKFMSDCGVWYMRVFVKFGNVTLIRWEFLDAESRKLIADYFA